MKKSLLASLSAAVLFGAASSASAAGDEALFRQNGYSLTWSGAKHALMLTAPGAPAKKVTGELSYLDGETTLDVAHQVILARVNGGTICPGGGAYAIDIPSAKAISLGNAACSESAEVAVEGPPEKPVVIVKDGGKTIKRLPVR